MDHEWDPRVRSKVLRTVGSSGPAMANGGAGK